MNALPSGNVTFLFTDSEGSTRLIQQHPEAMKDALARHNALLQGAIGAHRGHVFQVLGDGFCSAFEDAGGARALHAAGYAAIQRGDASTTIECYGQYLALVQDTENGIVKTLILASRGGTDDGVEYRPAG
jgi:class 3 adenylate cyclase